MPQANAVINYLRNELNSVASSVISPPDAAVRVPARGIYLSPMLGIPVSPPSPHSFFTTPAATSVASGSIAESSAARDLEATPLNVPCVDELTSGSDLDSDSDSENSSFCL